MLLKEMNKQQEKVDQKSKSFFRYFYLFKNNTAQILSLV